MGSRGTFHGFPWVTTGTRGRSHGNPPDLPRGISDGSSHRGPYICQIEPIVAGWVLVRRGTVWPEYVVESSSRLMFMLIYVGPARVVQASQSVLEGLGPPTHGRSARGAFSSTVPTFVHTLFLLPSRRKRTDRMWYSIELSHVLARTRSRDAFTRAPVLVHAACLVSVAAPEALQ